MADHKIQVEVSGDSSGLLGALSKGLNGIKGFAEGVKEQMSKAAEGSGKFKGEIGQLEGKIKSLREELVKLKQAEMVGGKDGALSAQIRATGMALSNAQRDLQLFKTQSGSAALGGEKLQSVIQGIGSVSPGAGSALSSLAGGPIAIVTTAIVGAITAAAGLTVALAEITKGEADRADAAGKTAQKIGMSVKAYTELSYVAKLADVDQEKLILGMGKFEKSLYEAIDTPTSQSAMALKKLGVEGQGLSDALRDPITALETMSEKFAHMDNDGTKTALAMEVFGRSGKELIPLLNQGKVAIAAMRLEADQLGVTFTEQDAKAAEEFNDNSKRLDFVMQGLKNTVGKELLPVLADFAQGAIDLAKEWLPSIVIGIKSLVSGFYSATRASSDFIDTLISGAKQAVVVTQTLATTSQQIQHGQFLAAKQTWIDGGKQLMALQKEHSDFMVWNAQETSEKIAKIWAISFDDQEKKRPKKKPQGDGKGDGGPDYTMWTAKEQEAMDKIAAIRRKGMDELTQLVAVANQGQAASRAQQIGFEEQDADEALKKREISNAEYIRRMQAFEDEKYQVALAALKEQVALMDAEPVKQAEIWNKIEMLSQAHQNRMKTIGAHTVQETAQQSRTMDTVVKTLQTGFGTAFANMLTGAKTFTQAISGFFKSMANTILNAIGQMISKTLLYKAVTIAANHGIITSETAKRMATLLGVQADTAAAAATTTKAAASSAAVGPNVANAASQTFETHSGIPIVGAIIAAALVLLMLTTMSKAKGRAVGGLVGEKGPELTMLGEKGLEVVAPEHDFRDWARGLVGMGANLGANLTYHRASVEALNRTAAGYASAPLRQASADPSAQAAPTPVQVHFNGPILDSSRHGMQRLGEHVMEAIMVAGQSRGVVIQPGQTFGRLS